MTIEELAAKLTVIIPAYNEAASIADTVRSLQAQTVPVHRIIVIDDGSTDDTGARAAACGAEVIRPPANTGSKAGAQNFALRDVESEFVMALDADTTLEPNALERLMTAFADPQVAAACGFVVPRHAESVWERGRLIEYLLAFTFFKQVQDYYTKPLISSGCFSAYRTALLKEAGGWSTKTLAEDVDLTWRFYRAGYRVRFMADAICYPIEPHNFTFMKKQLRRWSHGFLQNVRLHWRSVLEIPYLRSAVAIALWDAVFASFAYLFVVPILAFALDSPLMLLGYLLDAPAVLVPVVFAALQQNRLGQALASLPAFFVLRIFNGLFLLEALWKEFIIRQPLLVYEKGH